MKFVAMGASVRVVCRLCANIPDNSTDIFSFAGHQTLAQLIKIYLDIEIDSDDRLSSVICDCCREKMISFDNFAVECKKVQKTLVALHDRTVSTNETISNSQSDELLGLYNISVKQENDDNISVKSENFSDDFNDDDLLPISECIKKKSKKRKLKNSDSKSKHNKIKKLSIKSESEDNPVIKKEIDVFENDLDIKTNETDGIKKRTKKTKRSISNSFLSFSCHICSEEFVAFSTLKKHCAQTHGTRAMVKCMCDKYLYTRHSVNRHIVKHDESQGFKCKECKKPFATGKALQVHSYVHMPKDQYSHVCSHCAKRFPTTFALNIHEKTHLPKELRYMYPCDICGVKFISKSNVKTHISAVHEKNRPYVCDVCGHAFNNKGNLQDHRVLHNDEKLFNCPKCPKSFKTRGNLHRHIDCHGGTSYKCPECPAVLSTRRTLRTHMCIHEDTCRYICAFCNKGYKRRKSLKSHMNIHTGERPYCCQWCPKTFADNSNCRIHKKRMHPNELAEYEALHGKYQGVKDDVPEEKKVIYNISIKKKTDGGIIMIPDISELISEAPT